MKATVTAKSNPISIETEDKIVNIVEQYLKSQQPKSASEQMSIPQMEQTISELVSKDMDGTPWICLIEPQPPTLKWFQKPQNYHLEPDTHQFYIDEHQGLQEKDITSSIKKQKKQLGIFADGMERCFVSDEKYRVFMIKSDV